MHQEKHFQSSELIRDMIIGVADGLTVPFALAAGLSGAAVASSLITTAGLAEIAAGSIAMGQPVLSGAMKVVMIGILAAAAAFGIARWVA